MNEEKTIKLSYSSITTYNQCSYKYYLHYIEGIRPIQIDSPLFFGYAIDEAISHLLLEKKREKTFEESERLLFKSAEQIFIDSFTEKDGIKLPKNKNCSYFQSDFDADLLTEEDWRELRLFRSDVEDFQEFFNYCKNCFKEKKQLNSDNQVLFNFMCWLSLKNKGLVLIDAYRKIVLPEIEEVISIQKDINLPNQHGDSIVGKIDFIAKFYGDDNIYIVDNKTSSKPYDLDSVKKSDQLSIYCEAEGINNACYIVVEKKIRVNDPKVRISIIKDKIDDRQIQITFDNAQLILNNIHNGVFNKKSDPKDCSFFGKRCPYFSYCWENNNLSGLYKKEKDI